MNAHQFSRTAETSARKVAAFLIRHSHKHGDPVSNLKLQKLLYYSQGWYLALNKRVLFADQIEAWARGPVVRSVWQEYRQFRWEPIKGAIPEPDLSARVEEHLEEIMGAYGDHSAFTLERATHRESPWLNARGDLDENASSSRVIPLDDIYDYFSRQVSRKR